MRVLCVHCLPVGLPMVETKEESYLRVSHPRSYNIRRKHINSKIQIRDWLCNRDEGGCCASRDDCWRVIIEGGSKMESMLSKKEAAGSNFMCFLRDAVPLLREM